MGCVVADALLACEQAFGTALPKGLVAALQANKATEPSARLLDAGKLRWAWEDLLGQQGLGNKLSFARELLANRLRGGAGD